MATRSFDEIANAARAAWDPAVTEFAAGLGADLEAEVTEQLRLGRQLAEARRAAHLTQQQLSNRSHVGQAEISRIERGLGNPTRDTIIRLTAAMGAELAVIPRNRPLVSA
ncbi:helix-turn-helix domain-containing protein [Georgenia yuyongxinii]